MRLSTTIMLKVLLMQVVILFKSDHSVPSGRKFNYSQKQVLVPVVKIRNLTVQTLTFVGKGSKEMVWQNSMIFGTMIV